MEEADVSKLYAEASHLILSDALLTMFTSSLLCLFAVPSAIQPIQNVNITEGQNVTLSCNACGTPPLMVSWIKVGGDMSTSGSELVFTNINRSEAGDYMCEASNLCGNASETASIEVQCKSNIVSDYYVT